MHISAQLGWEAGPWMTAKVPNAKFLTPRVTLNSSHIEFLPRDAL